MHSIEITDDQYDRIRALRDELADRHADRYTSVTLPDSVAYLLDLAESVDDPGRTAEIEAGAVGAGGADGTDSMDGARSFPREALEAELTERNRRHTDPETASRMDLYQIAAEYEVSGRSSMTKGELVTAIVETIERRYTDPLAPVDFDVPELSPDDGGGDDDEQERHDDGASGDESDDLGEADRDDGGADGDPDDESADSDPDDGSADSDGQLNAMLNLLETHDDKWRSADGDARYEVDLPDGSVEAARTKDDVRAVLFKHY